MWICRICEPRGRPSYEGDVPEFEAHYVREHYTEPDRDIPYVNRAGPLKSAEVRAELDTTEAT